MKKSAEGALDGVEHMSDKNWHLAQSRAFEHLGCQTRHRVPPNNDDSQAAFAQTVSRQYDNLDKL